MATAGRNTTDEHQSNENRRSSMSVQMKETGEPSKRRSSSDEGKPPRIMSAGSPSSSENHPPLPGKPPTATNDRISKSRETLKNILQAGRKSIGNTSLSSNDLPALVRIPSAKSLKSVSFSDQDLSSKETTKDGKSKTSKASLLTDDLPLPRIKHRESSKKETINTYKANATFSRPRSSNETSLPPNPPSVSPMAFDKSKAKCISSIPHSGKEKLPQLSTLKEPKKSFKSTDEILLPQKVVEGTPRDPGRKPLLPSRPRPTRLREETSLPKSSPKVSPTGKDIPMPKTSFARPHSSEKPPLQGQSTSKSSKLNPSLSHSRSSEEQPLPRSSPKISTKVLETSKPVTRRSSLAGQPLPLSSPNESPKIAERITHVSRSHSPDEQAPPKRSQRVTTRGPEKSKPDTLVSRPSSSEEQQQQRKSQRESPKGSIDELKTRPRIPNSHSSDQLRIPRHSAPRGSLETPKGKPRCPLSHSLSGIPVPRSSPSKETGKREQNPPLSPSESGELLDVAETKLKEVFKEQVRLTFQSQKLMWLISQQRDSFKSKGDLLPVRRRSSAVM